VLENRNRSAIHNERAERITDRLRLSVTIELKNVMKSKTAASYRMADGI
jgi:hypothetical protein